MLFLPTGSLPPKKSKTGIVRGKWAGAYGVRARGPQVNARAPMQMLWRQVFAAAKRNWLSIGPGGANNAPTNGVDPQTAWAVQSDMYFGIVQPGWLENGVQTEDTLIGCSSAEAYQVMVQNTFAALDQGQAPTPVVTERAGTASGSTVTATAGALTLTVTPLPTYETAPLTAIYEVAISVAVSAYATPATDTQNGNQYWNFQPNQLPLTQGGQAVAATETQNPPGWVGPVYDADWSISSLPSGVTATIGGQAFPATLTPIEMVSFGVIFSASATATAGSYSITLTAVCNGVTNLCYITLVVYASAANTYILDAGSLPAGCVATFTPAALIPNNYAAEPAITASGTLALTIPNTATPATDTFSVSAIGPSSTATASPTITVSAITLTANTPPPVWNLPNTMSVGTIYDSGYNVTGFLLTYSWLPTSQYQTQPWTWTGSGWDAPGSAVQPGLWQITASDQYASSYSPPAVSSWTPILITGPLLPEPSDVLAAWVAQYGDLPDSGHIGFQMVYIDPVTGTVGPPLSAKATWQVGTLKGMPLSLWPGPQFGFYDATSGGTLIVNSPSVTTQTWQLATDTGYRGTVTFSLVSKTPVQNGNNSTAYALPPALTYAFSPASVTIAADYPTIYSTTLTLTIAADADSTDSTIEVEATDAVMTTGISYDLEISGSTYIPANWLSIDPGNTLVTISIPGSATATFTLYNSGPDEQFVVMLALYPNTDLSFTFSPQQLTVPPSSTTAATAANASTVAGYVTFQNVFGAAPGALVGSTINAAGYTPAGYNGAGYVISANDSSTITTYQPSTLGPQTVEGTITLTQPGTATTTLAIDVPATVYNPGTTLQIEAAAGNNTTNCAVQITL